ncbi:hypothetical protein DFJ74DRAFT_666332 [Hyaloraphidium curvatum]|nr:hypothetical protein DFJ74DRAFT_666332 [Hyaloraphidium curvatum]
MASASALLGRHESSLARLKRSDLPAVLSSRLEFNTHRGALDAELSMSAANAPYNSLRKKLVEMQLDVSSVDVPLDDLGLQDRRNNLVFEVLECLQELDDLRLDQFEELAGGGAAPEKEPVQETEFEKAQRLRAEARAKRDRETLERRRREMAEDAPPAGPRRTPTPKEEPKRTPTPKEDDAELRELERLRQEAARRREEIERLRREAEDLERAERRRAEDEARRRAEEEEKRRRREAEEAKQREEERRAAKLKELEEAGRRAVEELRLAEEREQLDREEAERRALAERWERERRDLERREKERRDRLLAQQALAQEEAERRERQQRAEAERQRLEAERRREAERLERQRREQMEEERRIQEEIARREQERREREAREAAARAARENERREAERLAAMAKPPPPVVGRVGSGGVSPISPSPSPKAPELSPEDVEKIKANVAKWRALRTKMPREEQFTRAKKFIEEGKGMKKAGHGHLEANKLGEQLLEEGFIWMRDLVVIKKGEQMFVPAVLYLANEYRADNFKSMVSLLTYCAESTGDPECCRLGYEAYMKGGPGVPANKRKAEQFKRWAGSKWKAIIM